MAANLPQLTGALATTAESGIVDALVSSDVMDPAALDQLGTMARGLVKGSKQFATNPVAIGGPFSLLGLMKDPDINRALSFFATVAKVIGQEISNTATAPAPTARHAR